MMSGVPLETCWAFNKLWNKFYYKAAFVGISTETSTMHGSMNIKFTCTVLYSQWNIQFSGLPLERGDSSAVGRGRPDHDQQHCYHQAPKVKPEAATAVIELLMMGVRAPETCWAVYKRQVINWRNCCILLVDVFELHFCQFFRLNLSHLEDISASVIWIFPEMGCFFSCSHALDKIKRMYCTVISTHEYV